MSIGFKIPTFAQARDFLRSFGKALFPDRNYGNVRSYHSRRAAFLAAAQTQLHAHIDSVQNDVMPDSAGDGAPINRWGETILGVERKKATPARKSAVGRVRGTAATPVDAGEELVHQASGLRYKIETGAVVGGSNYVDADIVAIDTGSQTKLEKGQVLEFVATPVGLNTQIVLQDDLDEDGLDDEPFGAYRERVLATFSEATAGGTQADYVAWILEVEGVSSGFAYLNRAGLGTTDIIGLHTGSGSDRELDPADQTAVLEHVRSKAPGQVAGTGGALRHLDVVFQDEDVEVVVEPNGEAAYNFDWTGGPVEVLAYTLATRTVQLNVPRPTTMKAGHRISFKGVGSNQDGREFVIEALSGAADSFILEEAPPVDPVATDLVYSGGPLVTPIRDAIVAHMSGETVYAGRNQTPLAESTLESTVGLEVLARGIGPANPNRKYGTWNGDLLRGVLGHLVIYKRGVSNYSIPTPAADVQGTDYVFPLDAQIGLIAPRRVLVRGAT